MSSTIILVDSSSSPSTYQHIAQDLIQKGTASLLASLSQTHPFEMVALLAYSGECDILCGFTRDFKALKRATVQSKTGSNLIFALESAVKYTTLHFDGQPNISCQVIIITHDHSEKKPPGEEFNQVYFQIPVQLHMLVLGERGEQHLTHYKNLCWNTSGSFDLVHIPQQSDAFLLKIHKLIELRFSKFVGSLAIGNMQTRFTLFPNPNTSFYGSVASKNNLPLWFPTPLSICGYIQASLLSSIPSLARFVILPEGNENAILYLLYESLKRENTCAIVALAKKKNWFGKGAPQKNGPILRLVVLLYSTFSGPTEKHNLVLSVCPKQVDTEWLGDLNDLAVKSKKQETALPIKSGKKSYDPQMENMEIDSESLQCDLAKILEYCHALPQSGKNLFAQAERIRKKSFVYSMPGILDCVSSLLAKEQSKFLEGGDSYNLLASLLQQISTHKTSSTPKPFKPPEQSETRSGSKSKETSEPTERPKLLISIPTKLFQEDST